MKTPRIEAIELLRGWGGATKLPSWSIGQSSSFRIKLDDSLNFRSSESEIELAFQLSAFVPNSKGYRRLAFAIDGAIAGIHYIYKQKLQNYKIFFPSEIVPPEGIEIDFIIDASSSPFEAGDSADVRKLGVYLSDIKLSVRSKDVSLKFSFVESGKKFALSFWPEIFIENAWANTDHLVEHIYSHIHRAEPASFVRFGDGEGRIFAYPDWMSGAEVLHEVIRYQFGPQFLARAQYALGYDQPGMAFQTVMSELKILLEASIRNADGVGLPTCVHFKKEVTNENLSGQVGFASALMNGARIAKHLPASNFFDTFAFRGVSRKGGFKKILGGLQFVGIIYHTDICEGLCETFGIASASFIKIPSHYSFKVNHGEEYLSHFPESYEEIVKNIKVPFQGAVFLIGAGYLGKVYCDVVKARGGIALDVGSVLDEWTGLGRTDVSPAMRLSSFRPSVP